MTGKFVRVLTLGALACSVCAAENLPEYLDVMVVRIKPEKRMEFEASIKKMVDANRKNNGDQWLTYVTEYGPQGTYYFTSPRADLSSIETASTAFMKALTTAFGKPAADKILAEFMGASIMTRAEIRRRRPDLSANPPKSQEDINKMVGESRWIRTIRVDLKPGKLHDFAELWNPMKVELQGMLKDHPIAVSQTIAGGPPAIWMSTFAKSFAEFDEMSNATKNLSETEAYRNYLKGLSDVATVSQFQYHRIAPELSNPPEGIAAVDPAFWHPKPAMPVRAKAAKAGD